MSVDSTLFPRSSIFPTPCPGKPAGNLYARNLFFPNWGPTKDPAGRQWGDGDPELTVQLLQSMKLAGRE